MIQQLYATIYSIIVGNKAMAWHEHFPHNWPMVRGIPNRKSGYAEFWWFFCSKPGKRFAFEEMVKTVRIRNWVWCVYTNNNVPGVKCTGIILGMCSYRERRRYNVTSSLIGWADTQMIPDYLVAVESLCCTRLRVHKYDNYMAAWRH